MIQLNRLIKVKFILIFAFLLVACGEGGVKIQEVKLIPIKSGKEYQYIDRKGNIVINPQFSEATVFRDGLALVKTSGDDPKFGYIKEDGKFEVMANFMRATVFSEGMAWVVSENSAPSAIDTKGDSKFTMNNAEKVKNFSNGLAAFMEVSDDEDKWGFVNKKGEMVINAQFSDVGEFKEDKCPVENSDGKWGFIDKNGKLIMNHQFDMAASFIGNTAVVRSGGKAGIIDKDGKYTVNPQYSSIIPDGNLFLVEQDGKYGWIDQKGKIVVNPQFNDALPFKGSELAAVKSGNKYGYINKEGKIIINPQFDAALPFNGNMALVLSSNKLGFVDKDGKYVINPQFEATSEDFTRYLLLGTTSYESVNTDFFNIDILTSRIDMSAPEGFKSSSKMSDILTKFKKSQDDFGKYSKEHKMISAEKISSDANLDFYVVAEPWGQDGYYSPWKFDANASPNSLAYILKLGGKGYGKAETVKLAFENSIKGMEKDVSASSGNKAVYRNDTQQVAIVKDGQEIQIQISYLKTKKNTVEVGSGHESSVDDDDFYPADVYRISDPDGYSNLRDTPNGTIIRRVLESEEFSVIGNKNNHEKVQLADGTIGFIHESRVVTSVRYKAFLKEEVTNVNVRNNYGAINSKVTTQISAPMTLTITKEHTFNNNGDLEHWIYIQEVNGWILGSFAD